MPYPFNPFSEDRLTPAQTTAYLERLRLPVSLLSEPPSLAHLTTLFYAQCLWIPKDTSSLHVPLGDWSDPDALIQLGGNHGGATLGGMADATERQFAMVVERNRGGFCFVTSGLFAKFLRGFGYRVSLCATRCYLGRAKGLDPETHEDGYKWGTITHMVPIVDWEGSDGRYMVDAGWGPNGPAKPLKLEHCVPSQGQNEWEAYEMRNEFLPLSPWMPKPVDNVKGWTLYRRITPSPHPSFPVTADSPGYWSPHLHFHLISLPALDIQLLHHFSATHELAHFTAFWLVTRLIPGGKGARRSLMYGERGVDSGAGDVANRRAKVFTSGGPEARGDVAEQRHVEWVEMRVGPMREALAREFDFKFGEEYH